MEESSSSDVADVHFIGTAAATARSSSFAGWMAKWLRRSWNERRWTADSTPHHTTQYRDSTDSLQNERIDRPDLRSLRFVHGTWNMEHGVRDRDRECSLTHSLTSHSIRSRCGSFESENSAALFLLLLLLLRSFVHVRECGKNIRRQLRRRQRFRGKSLLVSALVGIRKSTPHTTQQQ